MDFSFHCHTNHLVEVSMHFAQQELFDFYLLQGTLKYVLGNAQINKQMGKKLIWRRN